MSLFNETFAVSEGAAEGTLIGTLVANLMETTPAQDLLVFSAAIDVELIGCIFFTRLRFDTDARLAFLLSPVAVKTSAQGKGIGQALLHYGLDRLKNMDAAIAVTYGDPNYYSRVGFEPITEQIIPAPLVLRQPEGWLAMPLTDQPLNRIRGKSYCVDALNDPKYW